MVNPSAERPLVVIVGPTAVGKTSISIRLAQVLQGEIVSADSRQIYSGMDIGTAKATALEQAQARHHLLDLVRPDETLSLARYKDLATQTIDEIHGRGGIPFLVGGTGQYIMSIVEGWKIPRVAPNELLRDELYNVAKVEGHAALHTILQSMDPVAAMRIDARNVRRVVRALEVCIISGQPISELQGKSPPPYNITIMGLSRPRPELYNRIDRRVDLMIDNGLEEEVQGLIAQGIGFELPAMSGVGYGQFKPYFDGQASLDEVVQEIKRATRRFVRQQANWFRPGDVRIQWFEAVPDTFDTVLPVLKGVL